MAITDAEVLTRVDAIMRAFRRAMGAACRAYMDRMPDARRFDGRIDVEAAAFDCQRARAEQERAQREADAWKAREKALTDLRSCAGEWAELVPDR